MARPMTAEELLTETFQNLRHHAQRHRRLATEREHALQVLGDVSFTDPTRIKLDTERREHHLTALDLEENVADLQRFFCADCGRFMVDNASDPWDERAIRSQPDESICVACEEQAAADAAADLPFLLPPPFGERVLRVGGPLG